MANDRSIRSLAFLQGAATSRVFNLLSIEKKNAADNPGWRAQPLFASPMLNGAILLKHRLRSDETYLFDRPRCVATKIIIPFDRHDLRTGGHSFFYDQKGYHDALRQAGNYTSRPDFEHDLDILRLMDGVPSLDPFFLREHLRSHGHTADDCYFEISNADQARMFEYTSSEVGRLINLALQDASPRFGHTAKIVTAFLSSQVGEKLEPLRATLQLDPDAFREGIFGWRGFLYYKWLLRDFWPQMATVMRDIRGVKSNGALGPDEAAFIAGARRLLIEMIHHYSEDVRKVLAVYDESFRDITERHDPRTFREFLLGAPSMFLEIGMKMGAMTHVASFWNYRFPSGKPAVADPGELMAIFQDFASAFRFDEQAGAPSPPGRFQRRIIAA